MAITGIPGWIGSSAVNETGQRWMTAARRDVRLSSDGWMSQLAGRSREIRVDYTGSNHGFSSGSHLHPQMLAAAGGAWPGDNAIWRIVIHGGVQLVMANTGESMWFGGAIRGRVIIENHGWILGRGGNGGSVTCGDAGCSQNGTNGGHAIVREGHVTLQIENYGIIGGGGGGGGAAYTFSSAGGGRHYGMGGGGGCPFGAGGGVSGPNHPRPGGGASIDGAGAPGTGGDRGESSGGWGGGWGANGGNGNGNRASQAGGATGYAIAGGGPISYPARGDIRGPTS